MRLTNPPVDGAANSALIDLRAEALKIPRRALRIISGETPRTRVVEIDGIVPATVERLADDDQP